MSSAEGPQLASDRHVALVLSLYMGSDGLGAWPSQQTLMVRTGLVIRTIRPALKRLLAEGWLTRQARKGPRGIRAPRWGFEYRARLPGKLAKAYMNGASVALFSGKEPTARSAKKNGAISAQRMGQPLPPNTSGELIKGTASKKELQVSEQELAEMQRAFGEIQ